MYLKQLDIHGFKTFAEKTQIVFTPGITCVIGPNGSGKSNISDAILWVLGENNVRSLRGSTAQDIIFAGNDRRRPLGMAEVSLTIDNSGGILPLDFSEITVTRRLYRSGESEFLINKVSCRLKDIYELFLDTGVGRDAYSMINQGQIDQILSVRAEDRRAIFEEAAGIKKYRVRKKEAERKLENTRQNLLRVTDILSEIEGRLAPLQRQAQAAGRYRELATRLRALENAWYGRKIRHLNGERQGLAGLVEELREERSRLEAELKAAQESEAAARETLRKLDEEGEALRKAETDALQRIAAAEAEKARAEERAGEVQRRLKALEKELEEIAGRIQEQVQRSERNTQEEVALKREVDGIRAQLTEAQQRAAERVKAHDEAARHLESQRQAWLARARRQAELGARVESARSRITSLESESRRAAAAVAEAEEELKRLSEERERFVRSAQDLKEAAAAAAGELDSLRLAAREAEKAIAEKRAAADAAARTLSGHQARLNALTELGEKGEGAAQGARQLLSAVKRREVPGQWSLLVENLRVPEGLEKAVEAALGVYADALLCDSEPHASAGLQWLRSRKSTAIVLPAAPEGAAEPGAGTLGAAVQADGPAGAWARLLLGGTAVVDDLSALRDGESAIHLWVTRDGQWRTSAGALSGGPAGAEGSAAAMLARRRELERLREELPALEAAAEAARQALQETEGAARQSQAAVRERQSEADKARLEHQAALREAERRNADVERARHRAERLRKDVARIQADQQAAAQALARAEVELSGSPSAESQAPAAESDLSALQVEVGKLEVQRRQAEQAVTELRVRLAEQEQRLQGAIAASRRAVEAGAFLDRQRSDRLREQRSLTAEREQRQLTFGTLAQEGAEAGAAAQRARDAQAQLTERRHAVTAELNTARTQGVDLGNRLRELMERTHRAEVELAAVDTQRKHLGQQWLDATVSAHSMEAAENEEFEEPLSFTVEALLENWDPEVAELTLTSYSDPEAEISRLRRQIRALGAINPDAPEQYAEARERYDFLTGQKADLEQAREQLEQVIREVDAASRETFMEAFKEIAAAFDEMFKKLFGGGTTELRMTDPDDVLETGIDIIVQPPGKKQQNLLLLSGGERALTASAMLFALLKVRPSPFCVLDEVDAPLDEGNVGRFSSTLRDFAGKTQFIVVTHNRGTMEEADTIYGVTMEERGISKVLSCTLADPVVAQVQAEQSAASRN